MPLKQIKILVVDDDAELAAGTARVLERAHAITALAANGNAAWEALAEFQPDIVLTDWDMPAADGLQLCQRIKSDPTLADIMVVLISAAYTGSHEQATGLDAGADGYLARPITNRELIARMEAFVRIIRLKRTLQANNEELRRSRASAVQLMEEAVAARQSAEESMAAMCESEERFRRAVLDSPFPILLHAEDGAILQASNSWCEISGYSREELATTGDWTERAYGERKLQVLEYIDRLYSLDKRVAEGDYTIRTKAGGTRIWDFSSAPLGRLPDGRRLVMSMAMDVTQRRQAERELAETKALLQAAMDYSQAGIAIADAPSGQLRYVNRAGLLIRGATEAEAITGVDVNKYVASWKLLHLDGTPLATDEVPLARAVLYGEDCIKEFIIHRSDSEDRIVLANAAPIRDQQGQVTAAIVVFLDITERKAVEAELQKVDRELREKNVELEHFLYTASHDLKTPLVTVRTFLGYLEADLKKADAERIHKDMQFVRAAADKMARLLDEVLEVSRVGRIGSPQVQVTFQALVEEARNMVAGRIAQHNITLHVADSDVTFYGDRARLAEIFENLIDNACKFMGDQPAPRIEIGVETRDGEPVFFVRDNGIGIDPRYHAKVFGLFERLNPQTEGTGLGLALVKRVVELYHGRVWLESAVGHGASFYFTVPGAILITNSGDKK